MSISVTGEVTFARRLRAAKAAAARRPVPFAQFAAVWVVMATLRTTLFVITPGTAWQSAQLPLVARIGLACFGLVTVTSSPANVYRPESRVWMPAIPLISVLLPAPLSPTRAVT
jgi:hypothetical protein